MNVTAYDFLANGILSLSREERGTASIKRVIKSYLLTALGLQTKATIIQGKKAFFFSFEIVAKEKFFMAVME